MKGDREACLDAGMDDYVAKPVRSIELFTALEGNAISPASDATADSPPAESKPATGNDDETILDVDGFRESLGDTDLMRQLIDVFAEEAGEYLERARQGLESGDADALHGAAHSLKGLVGNYCAKRAFDAARELDEIAREGNLDGAPEAFASCDREVAALQTALEAFRDSLPGS